MAAGEAGYGASVAFGTAIGNVLPSLAEAAGGAVIGATATGARTLLGQLAADVYNLYHPVAGSGGTAAFLVPGPAPVPVPVTPNPP